MMHLVEGLLHQRYCATSIGADGAPEAFLATDADHGASRIRFQSSALRFVKACFQTFGRLG